MIISETLEPRRLLSAHGLSATYFQNSDFTGGYVERVDPAVNFSLSSNSSPVPRIKPGTFSVRWDGLVKPDFSETYTFSVRNNDGVRLWVNGQLIIDAWKASARATHTGTIGLRAHHLYDIRLEYFDGTRAPGIDLKWSSPSTPLADIP